MEQQRFSSENLGQFLDFAAKKGLLRRATAISRKIASMKILGVLDEAERADLRTVNVEDAFHRFQNKHKNDLKPESLAVYKSRFTTALSDFLSWCDDPAGFRPSTPKRLKGLGGGNTNLPRKNRGLPGRQDRVSDRWQPETNDQLIFPVPIREDVVVRIQNIPSDLTPEEAAKIAAVIQALAVGEKRQ